MNPAATVEFILYSRESCRLCRDFTAQLDSLLSGHDYTCHVLDVDSDSDLVHRYGARLPVLVGNGIEICESRFDADAIMAFVRQYSGRP
ncbi:MAG: glutaredoxin family protein [Gammaproteobacteria bacterium]